MAHRKPHEDDVILLMLAQGDERALTRLFHQYYQLLFKVVQAQLYNPVEADEIVQELFITIWCRRETLNLKSPLLRYLLKSVRNRTRNYLCGHGHRKLKLSCVEDLRLYEPVLTAVPADSRVHVKEIQKLVVYAKQQMTRSMRNIFELSREQGRSRIEIATELGVSVKAVEKSMTGALKIVKAIFKKHGFEEM